MSANYERENTHQLTAKSGESWQVQLQISGEAITSEEYEVARVPRLECRQNVWYEKGKPFEGRVEALPRLDPERGRNMGIVPAPEPPILLNADQIKALHSQGLRPEGIPAPLIWLVTNLGSEQGNKLLQQLGDETPKIPLWVGFHHGQHTERLVFVTTPLEALAHAQEHPEAEPRTYIATGDRLTPQTSREIQAIIARYGDLDRPGGSTTNATLAFPASPKGENLAQKVGAILEKTKWYAGDGDVEGGAFDVCREKPSVGKTWGDQVREHNRELVQSAPAKYRNLDRDR